MLAIPNCGEHFEPQLTSIYKRGENMVRGRVENIWRTAIFFLAVLAIIAVSNAAWAQRDEREEREQREQREQRDRYEHGYKVEHEHARPVDFGGGPGGSAVSDARC